MRISSFRGVSQLKSFQGVSEETLKPRKPNAISEDLSAGIASPVLRRAKIICTVGPACDSE